MGNDASGATRGGGDGLHNEDAFVVDEGLGLYVVCDGESSRPAGEVAAHLAAESVAQVIADAHRAEGARTDDIERGVVEAALRAALSAVMNAGEAEPELAGLATSVTVLLVQPGLGVIGHCGDSRAYLVRRGRVSLLTHHHPLTTTLDTGAGDGDVFEVFSAELEPGDTIILCSDGATGAIQEPALIRMAGELSPRLLASRIVGEAQRRSPEQDSTAVVVRIRNARGSGWLELSRRPHPTRFGHVMNAWPAPEAEPDRRTRDAGSEGSD
jgi:protein phosphatase